MHFTLSPRVAPSGSSFAVNCSVSRAGETLGSAGAAGAASSALPFEPALDLAGFDCADADAATAASTSAHDNSLAANDMGDLRGGMQRSQKTSIRGDVRRAPREVYGAWGGGGKRCREARDDARRGRDGLQLKGRAACGT